MEKRIRQRRSCKLAKAIDELVENCNQQGRPYYFNRTPISAMHNGNKKTFRHPLLFKDLEQDEKMQYLKIAEENLTKAEDFYNSKGDRICLSPRKEFIIMCLMEIYNEQCSNVYRANEPDFMKNSITGITGDVVVTPYLLACRIFGTNNPGSRLEEIREEIRSLCEDPETMVLLAYKEKVVDNEKEKLFTRVVYDHLIQVVPSADCYDGKKRYAIRLHEGIFFTRLKRNYILLHNGITQKLSQCYNGFPPRYTLNLLEYILVAGNNKDDKGDRLCQIKLEYLNCILCKNDAIKGNYTRLNDYFHDAVKALIICGVLSDTNLEDMEIKGGKENRKTIVTFHINENFFREKEDIDENKLILTPEV